MIRVIKYGVNFDMQKETIKELVIHKKRNRTLRQKSKITEIAVFFCRKLLIFDTECDIMIFNDIMY